MGEGCEFIRIVKEDTGGRGRLEVNGAKPNFNRGPRYFLPIFTRGLGD